MSCLQFYKFVIDGQLITLIKTGENTWTYSSVEPVTHDVVLNQINDRWVLQQTIDGHSAYWRSTSTITELTCPPTDINDWELYAFYTGNESIDAIYADDKSKLKFYLTGTDPLATQTDLSQSIGGYQTLVEINPSSLLLEDLNRTSTSLLTEEALSAPFIQINDEIVSVVSSNGTLLNIERDALSTVSRFHNHGDLVFAIQNNNIFNGSFSNNKQYRCMAVRNAGNNTFFDLKFYFKYLPLNDTQIKMAIEISQTEILTGIATSGSSISLVDTSLKNLFDDEYDNSILTVTGGDNINLGRKIASFDKTTGSFTFFNAFPYAITAGTAYRVENAPSQRVVSGINAPTTGTIYCSEFSNPSTFEDAISIDFSNTRLNGVNLLPGEMIYIWLEREISVNANSFDNNRVLLTASYRTSP